MSGSTWRRDVMSNAIPGDRSVLQRRGEARARRRSLQPILGGRSGRRGAAWRRQRQGQVVCAITVNEPRREALLEEILEGTVGQIEPRRPEAGVDPCQRRAVLAPQVRRRLGPTEPVLGGRKPR